MKMVDTYPELCARFPDSASFSLPRWREYALAVSPELPGKAEELCRKYEMERDVLPVIQAALSRRDKLEEAHASFLTVTKGLDEKICSVYGLRLDCTLVFYLGLCSGAGWATTLDGQPAVLLGAEKIVELDWGNEDDMRALVYHELGHLLHNALGCMPEKTPRTVGEKALFQLYQEGMAMTAEQELSGDPERFHQDRDGWLAWCREHENVLKEEFARRVSHGESCQDFFGDWVRFLGRPDTGYFLGRQFVRHMRGRLSLRETASLSLPDLREEWARFTEQE